jgi:APA family basic amino acid/polyamine antiporter
MNKNIFRIKTIEKIIDTARRNPLKKTLGALDLVLIAIGCTIGTGIFVVTGIAAAKYAGPAISVSYILAAIACMLAGLAYIELAALMPVAGSAYTYAYAVLGEFVAWIVATALILEYMMGAASVAAGWSGYFVGLLKVGGIIIPEALTKIPLEGGIINLPAVLISLFLGTLLIFGTKQGITLNRILVIIKLGAVFLFICVAAPHLKIENWTNNFAPFGFNGIIVGAATVFLAYIGFDAVATTAEECKNPNRDIPIGIVAGLLICTALYVSVALLLTGITNYSELNNAEPLAYALRQNGSNIGSALIATGAIAGIASVLLVLIYGQSRILFVISRDGLLPKFFSKIHPKFETPYLSCAAVAVIIAGLSGFCKLETIWQISSLGALIAFIISSFAVMILRIKKPNLPRPFKCPAIFIIAPLAIITCGYLTITLLAEVGKLFLIAMLISIAIYLLYSYKKSPVNKERNSRRNANFKGRYNKNHRHNKTHHSNNRNRNKEGFKTKEDSIKEVSFEEPRNKSFNQERPKIDHHNERHIERSNDRHNESSERNSNHERRNNDRHNERQNERSSRPHTPRPTNPKPIESNASRPTSGRIIKKANSDK